MFALKPAVGMYIWIFNRQLFILSVGLYLKTEELTRFEKHSMSEVVGSHCWCSNDVLSCTVSASTEKCFNLATRIYPEIKQET